MNKKSYAFYRDIADKIAWPITTPNHPILPERDYVTFGSLLSQIRLSSVCLSVVSLSVTLVHPTQGVEPFGKISSPLCTLAYALTSVQNFTEIVLGETLRWER